MEEYLIDAVEVRTLLRGLHLERQAAI